MYILKLALLSRLFVCFLLFPSKLSAQPLFTENPIVFGKVKTKSWKSKRDEGIVKQSLDFSCGAASLATLLNNFYGQKLTEREILVKMNKQELQASFDDMQRILPEMGFQARGYALSFEQLRQLKIPVIVYLRYRRYDHFSVLRGINGNTVLLADPSLGHVSVSKEQFLAAWNTRSGTLSGKILAVVPKNNVASNHGFFTRNPHRQTEMAVGLLQIGERY